MKMKLLWYIKYFFSFKIGYLVIPVFLISDNFEPVLLHLLSCCKIMFDYLNLCSNGFFMFGIFWFLSEIFNQ